MCNRTLNFCRPCFRVGMIFNLFEDKSHCCSNNVASIESFIEDVLLSINECPDEEVDYTCTAVVGCNLMHDTSNYLIFISKTQRPGVHFAYTCLRKYKTWRLAITFLRNRQTPCSQRGHPCSQLSLVYTSGICFLLI